MNKSKFDTDILFEFIPDDDKRSFIVWDNIILSSAYNLKTGRFERIVASYRTLIGEDKIAVPLTDYKQREREKKINEILK